MRVALPRVSQPQQCQPQRHLHDTGGPDDRALVGGDDATLEEGSTSLDDDAPLMSVNQFAALRVLLTTHTSATKGLQLEVQFIQGHW